jgi:bisphosphoglycerate-independent phosphoglycerate mutase
MLKTFYNARVITPEQIYSGGVVVENDRIIRVFKGNDYLPQGEMIDCGGNYLCPGFVDIHVHMRNISPYTIGAQPEMSAFEVCDKLVEAIKSDKYDVIIINFANPDMVGHTGVEDAAIKAVEAVDTCVGRAVEALKEVDGQMFICADHGNAEQLLDYETGAPFTAHTTNPVPFILVNADPAYKLREGGCLADIAPTLIELMGMEQPKEMSGTSLLVK